MCTYIYIYVYEVLADTVQMVLAGPDRDADCQVARRGGPVAPKGQREASIQLDSAKLLEYGSCQKIKTLVWTHNSRALMIRTPKNETDPIFWKGLNGILLF